MSNRKRAHAGWTPAQVRAWRELNRQMPELKELASLRVALEYERLGVETLPPERQINAALGREIAAILVRFGFAEHVEGGMQFLPPDPGGEARMELMIDYVHTEVERLRAP